MKQPKIIVVAGQAQHGKDTSASILKEELFKKDKTSLIIRYGDYLKYVATSYYGWDGLKDIPGRALLQTLGTEVARDNNPDIWVNVLLEFSKAFGGSYDYLIIPDFRYPNEYWRWVEEIYDIFSFWVNRNDFDNGLTEEQKNHRSETSLLDFDFDWLISVPSKTYILKDAISNMMNQNKDFFGAE